MRERAVHLFLLPELGPGGFHHVVLRRLRGAAFAERIQRDAGRVVGQSGKQRAIGRIGQADVLHRGLAVVDRVHELLVVQRQALVVGLHAAPVGRGFPVDGAVAQLEVAVHAHHPAIDRAARGFRRGQVAEDAVHSEGARPGDALRGQHLARLRAQQRMVGADAQAFVLVRAGGGIGDGVAVAGRTAVDGLVMHALPEHARAVAQVEVADHAHRMPQLVLQQRGDLRQIDAVPTGRRGRGVEQALVVGDQLAVAVEMQARRVGTEPDQPRCRIADRRSLAGAGDVVRQCQSAEGIDVGAQVAVQRQARNAVGGAGVAGRGRIHAAVVRPAIRPGIGDVVQRLPVEVVVRIHHALDIGVVPAQHHVAAVFGEVHPVDPAVAQRAAVALRGLAVVEIDFGTLVVVLEDDVDGAGDRVGAIGRRAADGQVLDPFDHLRRHRIEIDLHAGGRAEVGARARGHHPAAVDQGQRAIGAEAEAVDEVRAGRIVALPAFRRCREPEPDGLVERIGDVDHAAFADGLAGHHGRRLQRVEARARGNARTGDPNRVQRLRIVLLVRIRIVLRRGVGRGRGGRRGLCRGLRKHGRGQCRQDGECQRMPRGCMGVVAHDRLSES